MVPGDFEEATGKAGTGKLSAVLKKGVVEFWVSRSGRGENGGR